MIVAIAASSFLDKGYFATTMSGIALEIGGSKTTLWNYFPSKEELFKAVIDYLTLDYRSRIEVLFAQPDDPEQTLRSFCISFLEKISSAEGLGIHRLVYSEGRRFPEVGAIFYDRAPRAINRLLSEFIESLMAKGILKQDDPARSARLLTTLCTAESYQQLVIGNIDVVGRQEIEDNADVALDYFMKIYRIR